MFLSVFHANEGKFVHLDQKCRRQASNCITFILSFFYAWRKMKYRRWDKNVNFFLFEIFRPFVFFSLSRSNPLLKLFVFGNFCTVIKREGICLCCFCLWPSWCSFECDMKTDNLQTYKLQVTFKDTENITFNNSGVGKVLFFNLRNVKQSTKKWQGNFSGINTRCRMESYGKWKRENV